MHDTDWTGTAAAITAVALTIGVWLWPTPQSPRPAAQAQAQDQDDLSRQHIEAKRWDGIDHAAIQVSSAPAVPGLVR